MNRRGALIVFEGCDKTGKTTQCNLLIKKLTDNNIKSKKYSFPNRNTNTGYVLDKYLKKEINLNNNSAHLLFSSNRWETIDEIISLINNGITVIIDRYSYSGINFSFSNDNNNLNFYLNTENGLPKPDCTFYLETQQDIISKRNGFGNEKYENLEFQLKVKNNYEFFYKEKLFDFVKENTDKKSIENLNNILFEKILKIILNVQFSELKFFNFKNIT